MAGMSTPHRPTTTETLARSWGDTVARLRAELGLSQVELAARAYTTQQTISRVETGQIIPSDALKVRIALGLQSTAGRVFAWPEDDFTPDGAA